MGWQASGPSLGRSPGFQLRLVQNRLSTDLIDELVAAFQAGATHSELAARFNIAGTTVIAQSEAGWNPSATKRHPCRSD